MLIKYSASTEDSIAAICWTVSRCNPAGRSLLYLSPSHFLSIMLGVKVGTPKDRSSWSLPSGSSGFIREERTHSGDYDKCGPKGRVMRWWDPLPHEVTHKDLQNRRPDFMLEANKGRI